MLKKSINLFNSKIIIFIIVFILGLGCLILYNLFAKEEIMGYNFQPYPEFSPKYIPDINVGDDTCYKRLRKCDDGVCRECTNDYECVDVEREGQYIIDNKSVPIGKYCLPKKGIDEICNEYTGTWVWVNDPEYCGAKGNQCWKCICKYPDLFGGDDCSTQLACTPPQNIIFGNINEDDFTGKLKSTKALEDDIGAKEGTIYDPTTDKTDENTIKVLDQNLYGKNSKNEPYFQCDCTGNFHGKELISLPNDPYTCHANFCSPQQDVPGKYDPNTKNMICECGTNGSHSIDPAVNFSYGGTCDTGSSCGTIGPLVNTSNIIIGCNCPAGQYNRSCKSSTANTDKSFPFCIDMNNKIGYECVDPCINVRCVHGQKTIPPDNPTTCYCKCDDLDVSHSYKPPTCEVACIKPGSSCATYSPSPRGGPPVANPGLVQNCCNYDPSRGSANYTFVPEFPTSDYYCT